MHAPRSAKVGAWRRYVFAWLPPSRRPGPQTPVPTVSDRWCLVDGAIEERELYQRHDPVLKDTLKERYHELAEEANRNEVRVRWARFGLNAAAATLTASATAALVGYMLATGQADAGLACLATGGLLSLLALFTYRVSVALMLVVALPAAVLSAAMGWRQSGLRLAAVAGDWTVPDGGRPAVATGVALGATLAVGFSLLGCGFYLVDRRIRRRRRSAAGRRLNAFVSVDRVVARLVDDGGKLQYAPRNRQRLVSDVDAASAALRLMIRSIGRLSKDFARQARAIIARSDRHSNYVRLGKPENDERILRESLQFLICIALEYQGFIEVEAPAAETRRPNPAGAALGGCLPLAAIAVALALGIRPSQAVGGVFLTTCLLLSLVSFLQMVDPKYAHTIAIALRLLRGLRQSQPNSGGPAAPKAGEKSDPSTEAEGKGTNDESR